MQDQEESKPAITVTPEQIAKTRTAIYRLIEMEDQASQALTDVQLHIILGGNEKPALKDVVFAALLQRAQAVDAHRGGEDQTKEIANQQSLCTRILAGDEERAVYSLRERQGFRHQVANMLREYQEACVVAGGDWLLDYFEDHLPLFQAELPMFMRRVFDKHAWRGIAEDGMEDVFTASRELRKFLCEYSAPQQQAEPEPEPDFLDELKDQTEPEPDPIDELRDRADALEAKFAEMFGTRKAQADKWLEYANQRYETSLAELARDSDDAEAQPLYSDHQPPTEVIVGALLGGRKSRENLSLREDLTKHVFGIKRFCRTWAGLAVLEMSKYATEAAHSLGPDGSWWTYEDSNKLPAFNAAMVMVSRNERPANDILDAAWKELDRALTGPKVIPIDLEGSTKWYAGDEAKLAVTSLAEQLQQCMKGTQGTVEVIPTPQPGQKSVFDIVRDLQTTVGETHEVTITSPEPGDVAEEVIVVKRKGQPAPRKQVPEKDAATKLEDKLQEAKQADHRRRLDIERRTMNALAAAMEEHNTAAIAHRATQAPRDVVSLALADVVLHPFTCRRIAGVYSTLYDLVGVKGPSVGGATIMQAADTLLAWLKGNPDARRVSRVLKRLQRLSPTFAEFVLARFTPQYGLQTEPDGAKIMAEISEAMNTLMPNGGGVDIDRTAFEQATANGAMSFFVPYVAVDPDMQRWLDAQNGTPQREEKVDVREVHPSATSPNAPEAI